MGGYAFYVWSSVGITALVLIYNWVAPQFKRKALLREVAAQIRRRQLDSDKKTLPPKHAA